MTISGDKPAGRPALAVDSRLERDRADGIDNIDAVHSAVGAKTETEVDAKRLAEDSGGDTEGAVKGATGPGPKKALALAANPRATDKAGAVDGAADPVVQKAGALAAKQRAADKAGAVSCGAYTLVEKTGARAANQRAAAKGSADPVVKNTGVFAANQSAADKTAVAKGSANPEVEKAGELAANQRAADKAAAAKGPVDPEVEKAGALAAKERSADLVVHNVTGSLCAADNKPGAREKNKRAHEVDAHDTVSGKRRRTGTMDLAHNRVALRTSQQEMAKPTGLVTEAIDRSKREKRLCVICISGADETSTELELSLEDKHVAELISRCCVLIKLKEGSTDALLFSRTYLKSSIPSISFVGLDGTVLWSHDGYITSEDLKECIEKALEALNLQTKIEREVESANEKEHSVLNLHHPGYDCPLKHENKELDLTTIEVEDDHMDTTKVTALSGSRTLYMGNIPFTVEHNQVKTFFGEIGPISDVRIATHPEGKSKGFAHIEFSTAEAAQKALELNGKELLGRPVRLDLASDYSVHRKLEGVSRVAVRGFAKGIPENEIRSLLRSNFSKCGAIKQMYIPLHNLVTNGVAYIDFSDHSSFSQALKQDGSEVGGFKLFVSSMRGSITSLSGSRLAAELRKEFGD